MAADLLSTIAEEIGARLAELRPAYEEHEQLLIAAAALDSERASSTPKLRGRPPTSGSSGAAPSRTRAARTSAKPSSDAKRSGRGAAREAILAALEHGSHTLAELTVVTAMKTSSINGNLRRLLAEGAIAKTDREGKTAYRLAG